MHGVNHGYVIILWALVSLLVPRPLNIENVGVAWGTRLGLGC